MLQMMAALAGAGLALTAAALVLWFPGSGELVFYIQSSGANEVHFPYAYWAAAGVWMVGVASVLGVPLRAIAARAVLAAFVTHALLLLAAFVPLLADPLAFSTDAYRLYGRVFCVAVLAAAVAWSSLMWRGSVAFAAPVAVATILFAVYFAWTDAVALLAIAGGVTLAWVLGDRAVRDRAGRLLSGARAALAREPVLLVVMFAAALTLRLLYLQRVMSNPNYLETGADGPVYDELAWSIAQGHGIRESFTNRFPLLLLGYVWFVSGIYSLVGHSYFAVGAIQAVIGSAACVVFYDVAKQLCGVTIARIAAWFTVISFPLLFAAAAIGHQAIDVFLTVLMVWMLLKLARPTTPWWQWCAIGVLFGGAIAIRETVTFFLAFVLLWIPFRFANPWSLPAWRAAALVGMTAFVTIAPLTVPKVASVERRDQLRHHFDILYRGEADPIRLRDEIVGPLADPGAAAAQLAASPGKVLGTLGRAWASNFALQFFAQPYGGFDLVFLRKGTAYNYTVWLYVYALTVGGFLLLLRGLGDPARAAGVWLIVGLLVSRTIPHLIMESNYRHRVPIEPFLILLASIAVVRLVTATTRREASAAP